MKAGPTHKHSASAYSLIDRNARDDALPRTLTEDHRKWQLDEEKGKRTRPSHKRTMSDTSHSPMRERARNAKLQVEIRRLDDGHRTDRPQSPSDDEMSESELMIRKIISERVTSTHQIADLVVEARSSEEEESDGDTSRKSSVEELGALVEQFLVRQSVQTHSEQERRRELKRQILAIMQTDSEDKLSQRQTPQMSVLLSEVLRSSSTSTIMGPGGSFHVQDIFSSDDSIQELNAGIAVNVLPEKPQHEEFVPGSLEISPIEERQPLWKKRQGNVEEVQGVLDSVCLPGDLFLKQKKEVFAALCALPASSQIAVLLSNTFPENQYCGVYEVRADYYIKVTGSVFEPDRVPVEDVVCYLCFDLATRDFVETSSRQSFHAFRLKN